ncbi:MAG: hypothetical protein ACK5PZ_16175 [Pirellula sp.]
MFRSVINQSALAAYATIWFGVVLCYWVVAQPVVQFPSTSPTYSSPTPGYPSTGTALPSSSVPGSNPWATSPAPTSSSVLPPATSYPSGSTYNPYAPTFRPSTAPSSSTNYLNSWINWLSGNPPPSTSFGQPPAMPTGFGQPTGALPAGTIPMGPMPTGAPAYPGYPSGSIPTSAFPTMGYPTAPPAATFGAPVAPGTYPPGAFPPSAFSSPAYPSSVYPNQQPPVMFPGYGPNPYGSYPPGTYPNSGWNGWWTGTTTAVQTQTAQTMRLCQGVRLRYTYLPGNTDFSTLAPNALESNDAEISMVFAIPKFFGHSQPWYLMPSYAQQVWEGPSTPGYDMPGAAFSAFLDSSWESDPLQTLGTELGWRVGVFSAFDAVSSNSVRLQGKALARLRCTPNSTLRAGVYYIDRVKIKLLPAFGVLWVPNQDTRWDIFFPEPKLSHYLTTCGNTDIWWYVTGYYGGGTWTVKDASDSTDEVDIDDLRALVGFEFGRSDLLRQGFRSFFGEVGYAWNRQLVYRNLPDGTLDMTDSLVFRLGVGY